jgi:hypothetical protein
MEDLILRKKTEVFLNTEIYPALKRFPNAEKFCICQEIKQAFYRIIRNAQFFTSPRKSGNKITYLNAIDADLQLLLVLFSISRDQKYISTGQAKVWQEKIAEIGRINGGLMKSL